MTQLSDPPSPPVTVAGVSDRGRTRVRNEDAVLVDADLGLLVVADGMGGHPAGDVASALAVAEVGRRLRAVHDPDLDSSVGERMLEAVLGAHGRILDVAEANPAQQGMGTTVTALLVRPGRAVLAHVGDSRAYVLERDGLRQLTRDHTWVEQQIASGTLTPEQARNHRWAHVLVQAAGVGEGVEPDLVERTAVPGEVYLLCTDGLTNMLTDLVIERTLEDALPEGLQATARALVDAANDRGGTDNITVALLRID